MNHDTIKPKINAAEEDIQRSLRYLDSATQGLNAATGLGQEYCKTTIEKTQRELNSILNQLRYLSSGK